MAMEAPFNCAHFRLWLIGDPATGACRTYPVWTILKNGRRTPQSNHL